MLPLPSGIILWLLEIIPPPLDDRRWLPDSTRPHLENLHRQAGRMQQLSVILREPPEKIPPVSGNRPLLRGKTVLLLVNSTSMLPMLFLWLASEQVMLHVPMRLRF